MSECPFDEPVLSGSPTLYIAIQSPPPLQPRPLGPVQVRVSSSPDVTTVGLTIRDAERTSNVYAPASITLAPPGLVTTTSTVPASWAVVVAVMVVLVTRMPFAAVPPSVRVAPSRNPLPETRISEAKMVGPFVGEIADTVSAAGAGVAGGGADEADGAMSPECDFSHPTVSAA